MTTPYMSYWWRLCRVPWSGGGRACPWGTPSATPQRHGCCALRPAARRHPGQTPHAAVEMKDIGEPHLTSCLSTRGRHPSVQYVTHADHEPWVQSWVFTAARKLMAWNCSDLLGAESDNYYEHGSANGILGNTATLLKGFQKSTAKKKQGHF